MLDPRCHLLIKFVEAAPERRVGWGELRQHGSESGTEDAAVGSGAEPGGTQAEIGNAVAVSLGNAFDDAVQTEAAQVIGSFALGTGPGLVARAETRSVGGGRGWKSLRGGVGTTAGRARGLALGDQRSEARRHVARLAAGDG